jgi:hypothetical protein
LLTLGKIDTGKNSECARVTVHKTAKEFSKISLYWHYNGYSTELYVAPVAHLKALSQTFPGEAKKIMKIIFEDNNNMK